MKDRIKSLRNQYGYTQQSFSDLLGIPKRTIENWESGVRIPPEYVVNLIEFYLKNKGES